MDVGRDTIEDGIYADVSINGKQSGTLALSRPTGDGATAVAIVNLVRVTPAPLDFSETYEITLSAYVPHHATTPSSPPPVVGLDIVDVPGGGGPVGDR